MIPARTRSCAPVRQRNCEQRRPLEAGGARGPSDERTLLLVLERSVVRRRFVYRVFARAIQELLLQLLHPLL